MTKKHATVNLIATFRFPASYVRKLEKKRKALLRAIVRNTEEYRWIRTRTKAETSNRHEPR